jgi:hypothetical protein
LSRETTVPDESFESRRETRLAPIKPGDPVTRNVFSFKLVISKEKGLYYEKNEKKVSNEGKAIVRYKVVFKNNQQKNIIVLFAFDFLLKAYYQVLLKKALYVLHIGDNFLSSKDCVHHKSSQKTNPSICVQKPC